MISLYLKCIIWPQINSYTSLQPTRLIMVRPALHLSPSYVPGSCLSLPCLDKSELPDSWQEPSGSCGVNHSHRLEWSKDKFSSKTRVVFSIRRECFTSSTSHVFGHVASITCYGPVKLVSWVYYTSAHKQTQEPGFFIGAYFTTFVFQMCRALSCPSSLSDGTSLPRKSVALGEINASTAPFVFTSGLVATPLDGVAHTFVVDLPWSKSLSGNNLRNTPRARFPWWFYMQPRRQ